MADLVTVHLHGALGQRFGDRHQLDIASPAEAVRALCVLQDGFRAALAEGAWRVVAGPVGRGRDVQDATLDLGLGRHREVHILPAVIGAGGGDVLKVILGTALVGLSLWNPVGLIGSGALFGSTTASAVFGLGASMALTGISSLISPQQRAERSEAKRSYGFSNDPANAVQGAPVPLIFGEVITEPRLISGAITTEDVGKRDRDGNAKPWQPHSLAADDGIEGAGGLLGGGAGGAPKSDDDTLESVATARLLYLVGAGPIVGLVDGARSIYLNGTPLQAPDGSWNFKGVDWWFANGAPDQAPPPGQDGVENTTPVRVEVKRDQPVVRTITNLQATAARVTTQIPQLYKVGGKGQQKATDLYYDVQVRPAGGVWTTMVEQRFNNQKTLAAYERMHLVPLPGNGPWDLRVVRISDDPDPPDRVNPLVWQSYAEIVEGKFNYPDCALLGLSFDAKSFGGELPRIKLHLRGLAIPVPINYDPVARTYAGAWDGRFKADWCANPAWIARYLLTDPLDGLGAWIGADAPDKWALYSISQYSDQLVPDGYGGMEPRYAYHDVLQERQDAYAVLQGVASAWRGMAWWASGSVAFSVDMPSAPIKLVNQSNVENGVFTRSETPLSARKTAVQVVYRDPQALDDEAWEYVDDPEAVRQLGLRETEIRAPGCRSRGQARRLGRWFLDTERQDRGLVYTAGADHWDVNPGDVIAQADPVWMGLRWGGRVLAAAGVAITLDAPIDLVAGKVYRLQFTQPDGKTWDDEVTTGAGTHQVLTLRAVPPQLPRAGAVWGLSATDLVPPQWQVVEVTPDDSNALKRRITAVSFDPTKFARVELGLYFDPIPTSNYPTGRLKPPTDLALAPIFQERPGGRDRIGVTLSWRLPPDLRAIRFAAELRTDAGPWRPVYEGAVPSCDILDLDLGAAVDYRVQSLDALGGRSEWAYLLAQTPVSGRADPPGPPSQVQAIGDVGEIRVVFTPDRSRSDFRATEVWVSKSDQFDTGWLLAATPDTWVVDTVPPLERRWYWLRTVTHDVGPAAASAWVGPWSAESLQITDPAWLGRKILNETHLDDELRKPIGLIPAIQRGQVSLSDVIAEGLLKGLIQSWAADEHAAAAIMTETTTRASGDFALALRIDTVAAAVGDNAAAIQTEITARVNGDNALAQQITTVQTTVNGHTVSIQQQFTSIDGLRGQYTVKIDNNGHVTGFGLASEPINGVPVSTFAILVDRFVIASPNGLATPFSVAQVGGVWTVAISNAVIGDLTITGRTLGYEAATLTRSAVVASWSRNATGNAGEGWDEICRISWTSSGRPILISAYADSFAGYNSGPDGWVEASLRLARATPGGTKNLWTKGSGAVRNGAMTVIDATVPAGDAVTYILTAQGKNIDINWLTLGAQEYQK